MHTRDNNFSQEKRKKNQFQIRQKESINKRSFIRYIKLCCTHEQSFVKTIAASVYIYMYDMRVAFTRDTRANCICIDRLHGHRATKSHALILACVRDSFKEPKFRSFV